MKRHRSSWSGPIIVLGSLLPFACDRSGDQEPAGTGSSPPPNVVIITLGTTRADRLGCYGHDGARTPVLDALASSGARFARAFCQVPLTLPSHTTLLTGRYPATHGVRVNGSTSLGKALPTLAERFKQQGYHTAAFVSAFVLDSRFGLGRGFDVFDDALAPSAAKQHDGPERPANEVCEVALEWLDEHRDGPFLAWVHFFDPHTPYDPPAAFRDEIEDPYDGEIAFVDEQIGRLVAWLDARDLRGRTLIVVAGDHGESFAEHDEPQHGLFLYDTTLHVPLIFSGPGLVPAGVVEPAEVQLVDVFATIMEVMQWDASATDGRSLVDAWSGGALSPRSAYAETQYPWRSYGWSPLRSITQDHWKYIEAPRPELYDRDADPGETNNVLSRHPNVAIQLRDALTALEGEMEPHAADPVALDSQSRSKLESLGYLASAGGPDSVGDTRHLRDPKDGLAVYRMHLRGNLLLQRQDFAEAARVLESATRQSPESDEIYTSLAKAYLELGRAADAETAFSASLRTDPDEPHKLWGLGEACRRQRKTDQAVLHFNRALALMPDLGPVHLGLGLIYAGRRDFDRAHEHCRRHFEIDPTSPIALRNFASVLFQTQRFEESVTILEAALKQDPASRFAHSALWQALKSCGRIEDAILALRRGRDAFPTDAEFTCSLAWTLAVTPGAELIDEDEAVRLANQCLSAQPNHPRHHDVLAAAFAARGDFAEAVKTATHAISLARDPGLVELRGEIEARLELYKARKAYRE